MRSKLFLILVVSFLLMISVVYGGIELDCAGNSDCTTIYDSWNFETLNAESNFGGINGGVIVPDGVGPEVGKVGNGIKFDGFNDKLQIDLTSSGIGDEGRMFSMWLKPSSKGPIITSNGGIKLSMGGGPVKCNFGTDSITSQNQLSLNTWVHVSCGVVGKKLFLYVDGKEANTAVTITSSIPNVAGVRFGTDGDAYIKATMDEIIIDVPGKYSKVADIVKKHYRRGVLNLNKFSASTRDIVDTASDLSKVSNFKLVDEAYNIIIKYQDGKEINVIDEDFSGLKTGKGFFSFDTTNMHASLLSPTEITIPADGCEDYKIYYSSAIEPDFKTLKSKGISALCPDHVCLYDDCNYVAGVYEVSFEITGFSSYGAEGSAPPANHAIYLGAGSNFSDINDNAIYLSSNGADGVYVNDSHHLQMARNIINTAGDNSSAIFIRDSSYAEIRNNSLTTFGSGSAGVLFSSDSDPLKTHSNEFENNMIETNDYSFIGPELGYTIIIYYDEETGGIRWNITSVNTTFDFISDNLYFQQNLVGLPNDPDLMDFNSTAMIALFNLSYPQQPFLLKDGIRCDDTDACNITSWNDTSGQLYAMVAGFSNYTTEAGIPSYNLTVFIDGVEGSDFSTVGKPYNLTVLVTDPLGNPLENELVQVWENGSRVFFALPQSGVISSARGEMLTDSNGLISMGIITTGSSPLPDGYNLFVGVSFDGQLVDNSVLSFSLLENSMSPADSSISIPNQGLLAANIDTLSSILSSTRNWFNQGGGGKAYQVNITGSIINFSNNQLYSSVPSGVSFLIKDNLDNPIINSTIIIKEQNGRSLFSLPQPEPFFGYGSANLLTNGSGIAEVTIIPTGVSVVPNNHSIYFEVYSSDGSFIINSSFLTNESMSPYDGGQVESLPNQGEIAAGIDVTSSLISAARSWFNY